MSDNLPEIIAPNAPAGTQNEVTQWATAIRQSWQTSLVAIFETGGLIAEAKAALPHGAFTAMVNEQLPFGARTAQILMRVASDSRLTNAKHASLLPPSWMALYELSKLDDEMFEARIADGTIRADMQRNAITALVKKHARVSREQELAAKQIALPEKRYGVVLTDDEWEHETWSDLGMLKAASNHYPVSSLEQLKERDFSGFTAPDCVLFMWSTVPHLAQAFALMAHRGFAYKSQCIWNKIYPGNRQGKGYWFRINHEVLLVGTKGNVPAPAPGDQWPSVIDAPVGEHSEKPEIFHELIESYFPSLPKIELNARRARAGWDTWGYEAPGENPEAKTSVDNGAPDLERTPDDSMAGEVSRSITDDGFRDANVSESVTSPGGENLAPDSQDANALIRAAYQADAPVDFAALMAATGLAKTTIRNRAFRMGLSSRDRQRKAAARAMTATNGRHAAAKGD